jgi:hypothetical protein
VFKIVADEPAAANQVNTTLTPRIDEVLRKGLAKKPEDRFANCASFVGALEMACAESRGWKTLPAGAASAMPTVGVETPSEPKKPVLDSQYERDEGPRKSRLVPLLLSLALVTAVGAVFLYQSGLVGGQAKAPDTITSKTQPEQTQPQAKADDPRPEPPAAQDAPQPEPAQPEPETKKPPVPAETAPAAKPEPSRASSNLSRQTQDVWVTSNPPGAKAVLDGNLIGDCRTPCMLRAAPGRHTLTISQAGYLNEYRQIDVGDTATDVPQIVLRQPQGTLFLTTTPPGAAIRVDGRANGEVTPARLTLAPGSYTITVEKNGVTKTEQVRIDETLKRLSIPLQP